MLAFSSLSDTAMRLYNQDQFESAYRDRLIAHDEGKGFQKYMKGLKKAASITGGAGADGDALIADLTRKGAMK